jgi:L-seryl-tRNA(Ser) seleniumtransferase
MKVGKEEIIGLITAVNRYVSRDHDAVHATWNAKARYIAAQLEGIPGVKATIEGNPEGFESIRLSWDQATIPLDGLAVAQRLKDGEPRIVYYEDETGGLLQTRTMRDGEEVLVARRLRQFFLSGAGLDHGPGSQSSRLRPPRSS